MAPPRHQPEAVDLGADPGCRAWATTGAAIVRSMGDNAEDPNPDGGPPLSLGAVVRPQNFEANLRLRFGFWGIGGPEDPFFHRALQGEFIVFAAF